MDKRKAKSRGPPTPIHYLQQHMGPFSYLSSPFLPQKQKQPSLSRFIANPLFVPRGASAPILLPPSPASSFTRPPPTFALGTPRLAPFAPASQYRDWATVPEPPVPRLFQGSSLPVKDRLRGAWKPVRGRARERRASELRD